MSTETQEQGAPIFCFDNEGRRHSVFEVRTIREDNQTGRPEVVRSNWYRLTEGYGKPVEKFIDSETGDAHFRCPDLDGLVLVPDRPIPS